MRRPPLPALLAALLLPLLGAPVRRAGAGEDPVAWGLPPRGAALYDRVVDVAASGRVSFLAAPPRAAVVLDGELSPERTHVAAPLHDLRDLPLFLAADLREARRGGVRETDFADLVGLGPHHVVAMWGAPTPDGRQPLLARITPVAGDEAGSRLAVRGSLRLTRRVDLDAGRLAEFECRFEFAAAPAPGEDAPPAVPPREAIEEHWTLREVLAPGEAAFRLRVGDAIRRSAAWLRDQLPDAATARNLQAGYLALPLLAVLKSEEFAGDPVVARALNALRGREMDDTYSLALALMTIEAAHAPHGERDRLMADPTAQPAPRRLDPTDRAVVERWTRALLDAHDTRVDPGYLLRWRYRRMASYDNSNTQYALLGLYSAHLCGMEIPRFTWESSATHWLDDQAEAEGRKIHLDLTSHEELEERERAEGDEGDGGETRARGPRVRPAGWGYVGPNPTTGSMTSGGISSLTIANAAARGGRGLGGGLEPLTDKAIRRGLAWLAEHFTVRANPGFASLGHTHFYYLYSLERALELNRIALLNGRDWYFEGAVWLLETQAEDGSWPGGVVDSAFALLFLKKAVPPVVTITR